MHILTSINSERHRKALNYALAAIRKSELAPYVSDVLLYGSCSRGEEKYSSDLDLFIVLIPEYSEKKELRRAMRLLKSEAMTDDINDPEVDLKIVVGNGWENNKMLYYRNVKKDGVSVWR